MEYEDWCISSIQIVILSVKPIFKSQEALLLHFRKASLTINKPTQQWEASTSCKHCESCILLIFVAFHCRKEI